MKKILKSVTAFAAAMALTIPMAVSASSNGSNSSNASSASSNAAKLEEKVVVYSTHPENMLTKIADGFTAKTGVKVEFINLKGELAQRIRSEKDNPQADIMFGGASSLLITMEKEGLFEKTEPNWAKDLKDSYKSKEGFWYGTIKTPMVIFFNKDKVTVDKAPKSWVDLSKEDFKDMIVSRDAGSSSQKATVAALYSFLSKKESEDKAVEYLKALDKNTLNYYANGNMHFQAVGKGDAPISYAVMSAVNDNVTKNGMPLQIVEPEEGNIIILDGIAMIKNAKHPEAAKAFLEYAGSTEVQNMLAKEFGRMPVLDLAKTDIPEYMLAPMKEMEIDWYEIADKEAAIMEKWMNEIKDQGKDIKGN